MNSRVLFTCVGSTDPVRSLRDGAMLHIIRHYRPEKVYIVLSKEMKQLNEVDHRFDIALDKFSKDFNLRLEKEYIDSDIEDVSDFDAFGGLFNDQMKSIRDENPNAEILLNLSSGTPQMKVSMCLLAQEPKFGRVRAVQVKTPEESSNKSLANTHKTYSAYEEIELNEDNEDGAPNRCTEPQLMQVRKALILKQIAALINSYHYEQARLLITDYYGMDADNKVLKIIDHLISRQKLKKDRGIGKLGIDFNFYPVEEEPFCGLIDYYMMLNNLRKIGRMSEFMLRLNPYIIRLQEEFLARIFGFDLTRITYTRASDEDKLSREKLEAANHELLDYLDRFYRGGLKDNTNISMNLLNGMLKYFDNQNGQKYRKYIDFFELCEGANKYLRNKVAHTLSEISEAEINQYAKMSSDRILKEIQKSISFIYKGTLPPNAFTIYDDLNRIIIDSI
ncbi:MAG: hypothetical protein GX363_09010 [Clostridiales bacterium]|nr:hypothetical protein [Clostridiales bacterium]